VVHTGKKVHLRAATGVFANLPRHRDLGHLGPAGAALEKPCPSYGGDQRFESPSLQRGVRCEPDFRCALPHPFGGRYTVTGQSRAPGRRDASGLPHVIARTPGKVGCASRQRRAGRINIAQPVATPGANEWLSSASSPATSRSGKKRGRVEKNLSNLPAASQPPTPSSMPEKTNGDVR
jgi:hypothetical protein